MKKRLHIKVIQRMADRKHYMLSRSEKPIPEHMEWLLRINGQAIGSFRRMCEAKRWIRRAQRHGVGYAWAVLGQPKGDSL